MIDENKMKTLGKYFEKYYEDKMICQIFSGIVRVLKQKENPDRLAQACNSFALIWGKRYLGKRPTTYDKVREDHELPKKKEGHKVILLTFLARIMSPKNIQDENALKIVEEYINEHHKFFKTVLHHGDEVIEREVYDRINTVINLFLSPWDILSDLSKELLIYKKLKKTVGAYKDLISLFTNEGMVHLFFGTLTEKEKRNWILTLFDNKFFHEKFVYAVKYFPELFLDYEGQFTEIIKCNFKNKNLVTIQFFIHLIGKLEKTEPEKFLKILIYWIDEYSTCVPDSIIKLLKIFISNNKVSLALKIMRRALLWEKLGDGKCSSNTPSIIGGTGYSEIFPKIEDDMFELYITSLFPDILNVNPIKAYQFLGEVLIDFIEHLNKESAYRWDLKVRKPLTWEGGNSSSLFVIKSYDNLVQYIIKSIIDYHKLNENRKQIEIINFLDKFDSDTKKSRIFLKIKISVFTELNSIYEKEILDYLDEADLFSKCLHHENYHLLKSCFILLGKKDQTKLLERIDNEVEGVNNLTKNNNKAKLWFPIENGLDDGRKDKLEEYKQISTFEFPDRHIYSYLSFSSRTPFKQAFFSLRYKNSNKEANREKLFRIYKNEEPLNSYNNWISFLQSIELHFEPMESSEFYLACLETLKRHREFAKGMIANAKIEYFLNIVLKLSHYQELKESPIILNMEQWILNKVSYLSIDLLFSTINFINFYNAGVQYQNLKEKIFLRIAKAINTKRSLGIFYLIGKHINTLYENKKIDGFLFEKFPDFLTGSQKDLNSIIMTARGILQSKYCHGNYKLLSKFYKISIENLNNNCFSEDQRVNLGLYLAFNFIFGTAKIEEKIDLANFYLKVNCNDKKSIIFYIFNYLKSSKSVKESFLRKILDFLDFRLNSPCNVEENCKNNNGNCQLEFSNFATSIRFSFEKFDPKWLLDRLIKILERKMIEKIPCSFEIFELDKLGGLLKSDQVQLLKCLSIFIKQRKVCSPLFESNFLKFYKRITDEKIDLKPDSKEYLRDIFDFGLNHNRIEFSEVKREKLV